MFGVVPKVLWQKQTAPDEHNRILLALRTLVAVDPAAGRVVLVDTGAGSKWAPDQAARYGITHDANALPSALAARGLTEDDVTDVVVTHLHFDHAGGMTHRPPDGPIGARFPRARHWIHSEHLAHARKPTLRDRASFFPHDFEPLAAQGLLVEVGGAAPPPPFPGVRWWLSHGHTPYQLLPWFEDDAHPLLFVGDLIPMTPHLPSAWVMGYDLYPVTTVEEKERVLEWCASDGLHLAFSHDPRVAGAEVQIVAGRPKLGQVLDL